MFRKLHANSLVGLAGLFVFLSVGIFDVTADDWPQWGGPQRDLVWRETGIVDQLPDSDTLPRVWSTPISEGYGGPSVADGRVYVMDRLRKEQRERVLCLDAATGKVIWRHDYEARYSISYPAGPRCTPVIDNDRVYIVGAVGHMFCPQRRRWSSRLAA